MQKFRTMISSLTMFGVLALPASAGICDYRLSSLIGSMHATEVVGGATLVASTNLAMQASGIYLITNFTTGATMLGSTAAGASAAGTVGIIGGTSAGIGAAASVLSAPITIAAAGIAALAGMGMEGGCYFADERITDFHTVYKLVQEVVATGDPTKMGIFYEPNGPWLWLLQDDKAVPYEILNLYVVNGELMHRDWGPNTDLGHIFVKVRD